MTSFVTFLANWLPYLVTIVGILGAIAGVSIYIATRRHYYDEYKRRKNR